MHIGIYSYIMGKLGGPAVFDQRLISAISKYDSRNRYTLYGTGGQSASLDTGKDNFDVRTIRPSSKWLAVAFGLTYELKKRPVDLLHATFIAPPVVPCRFIITMTCWSQYANPEFYTPLRRWRLLYLLNGAVRKASAVFCYSMYLKERLMEKFALSPERVFVTRPGVGEEMAPIDDKERLRAFLDANGIREPYILFIGQFTKRKNVDGLIRAYGMLRRDAGIRHKLVLVGENMFLYDDIYKAIDELNLGKEIIFAGRRPHSELPLFYSGADVFVFPTFSEGFGLPPLEAMACGTPVVASNATSVPEVVGDAAVLVNPHDVEDMAAGIHKGITDRRLRESLIAKGRAHAGKFTWTKTAEETVKAYEKVFMSGW